MKSSILTLMIAIMLLAIGTAAFGVVQTGKAGKYTVTFMTTPDPPVAADNVFTINVKDGDKPLVGGVVNIHADMPAMKMPSEYKTKPGTNPGEYICPQAYLGMEDAWIITIKVQQMEGMAMDGDGQVDFPIMAKLLTEAVKPPLPAKPVAPASNNMPYIIGGAVLLLIIVIIGFALGKKGTNKE